jgi:lipoprotein-releasing system permease protein
MRFELFIASRYLRAKRRQAVIGVITAISVIGVAAGVASLVIALAINNGFRQDLQEKLLGASSHVNVMRVEADGIRDWQPLLEKLEKQPGVKAGAPAIYEQVLVSRGARATGAVAKGILPQQEKKVSELLQAVKFGSADALEPSAQASSAGSPGAPATGAEALTALLPPIVLGNEMANDLGATVGSVVLVTSPQGELTPFGIVPKYVRFKVVGIFNSGFYDYDKSWAFIRLRDAQQLFGLGDVASVLEFKVDDINRASEIGHQLEQAAGKGFMSSSWMEQNKQVFEALQMERRVMFLAIGLIVLVAALNILISLTMMVMEKTRDIAVLMSMGAKRSQIVKIFIGQGMLIGVIGTFFGLILGYLGTWALSHYQFFKLNPEVYSIAYVPASARMQDGVYIVLVALAISFLATIYPAFSASRILPAEALRYE